MVQHSLAVPAIERYPSPALGSFSTPTQGQLPAPDPPPRELDDTEIAALISNASDDLRLAVAALLMGLSPAEIVALSWEQIDFASAAINVGDPSARTIRLEGPLAAFLKQRLGEASETAATILHTDRGESLTLDDLNRLVLYGGYDAGLDRPQEVTSAALRHTYLAFLLRQGIRAADIGRIAGQVPQEEMLAHMQTASARTRLPLEQIDCIHPVLRDIADRVSN